MTHRETAERFIGSIVQCSSPAVSPDGRLIAFVVSRVDMRENGYRSQVWLASADGTLAPHPITSGDHDGQPTWSPDGTLIAFTASRSAKDSDTTLHSMRIDGPGEVRTLATMPDGIESPAFSPDGRWIAFASRSQHERYAAKDESWQAPRKIEHFFTRLDNENWVFDRPSHIYVAPVDGTAAPRNLTSGNHQHHGLSWASDSAGLITASRRHDTWDFDFAADLYLIGLDGAVTALTMQTGVYGSPAVSPGGTRVAFLGVDDPSTTPQNSHVGVVDIGGGAHQWHSRALDRTFETTAGSSTPVWESEVALLGTVEDRGQTHLVRVFIDGRSPEFVTSGPLTVKSFDANSGTIALAIGAVDRVADLYVIREAVPVALTDFGQRYAAAVSTQPWERFAVPTADATAEIDAWIMRPVGFDPTHHYPVLLNVHGGPHTQYGETLFDEAQMQAAAGFVVVMCNPRGSSGREQAWGQAIIGPKHPVAPGSGWGGLDVDDVLSVLDAVLDRYGFCDPARVGMLGGSYGGFMATWLAGRHGERFRAICSERAVNNMVSEEWSSDFGSEFRTEVGPSHLDDPDAYLAFSPVRFARDISVPMLLIHSENDLRCPIAQAEELFMALRLLGKDVTFYRFPGECHELTRSGSPIHRVQRAEIILDWFHHHLTPA